MIKGLKFSTILNLTTSSNTEGKEGKRRNKWRRSFHSIELRLEPERTSLYGKTKTKMERTRAFSRSMGRSFNNPKP